jgi:hypothetical protein
MDHGIALRAPSTFGDFGWLGVRAPEMVQPYTFLCKTWSKISFLYEYQRFWLRWRDGTEKSRLLGACFRA